MSHTLSQNVPRVHEHSRTRNKEGWFGSEVTVYISGNWTTYRSRILSYMRQLAIITPYAEFTLDYTFRNKPKRAFSVKYARRAQKMPPLAKEVRACGWCLAATRAKQRCGVLIVLATSAHR